MITVTVLLMVAADAPVLLGGIACVARSRAHMSGPDAESHANAGWMAAVFSGDSGGDCSAGDAGCDGGGGGGE